MPRYTIDRFEDGDWAVLEDERARMLTVPRTWLPSSAREGDVLQTFATVEGARARTIRFELDLATRDEQLAKARQRRDALPKGPKGDISL